jgi:hypothetical protein
MNRALFSVTVASLVVLIYVVLSTVSGNFPLLFLLLLLSQAMLVWMVITILKDKSSSSRTFDEYFYEDSDIRQGDKGPH